MTDDAPREFQETDQGQRCGVVAVIGAPNAGKSTLVNRIVGTKVSIVTHKVQTTRARVRGILLDGPIQVVFADTPGIFEPRRRLDRAMVHAAWSEAADADVVLLVVDAAGGFTTQVRAIVAKLEQAGRTAVLALNKVDKINPEKLLALSQALWATGRFTDVFMISAEKGSGVADLEAFLGRAMPTGPWLFPEDQVSDLPLRQLAAEITREKVFLQLHQELPYAATVETESWEDRKDGSIRIEQVILVTRANQRAIVLGKGGSRIKRIGQEARLELEELLETKVHLFLHVKVDERWMDSPDVYRDWGLDFEPKG